MRKIEKDLTNVIVNNCTRYDTGDLIKSFKQGNTKLYQVSHGVQVLTLHGNTIARVDYRNRTIDLSNAGWVSRTTHSRLNALLEALVPTDTRFVQRRFVACLANATDTTPIRNGYWYSWQLCPSLFLFSKPKVERSNRVQYVFRNAQDAIVARVVEAIHRPIVDVVDTVAKSGNFLPPSLYQFVEVQRV